MEAPRRTSRRNAALAAVAGMVAGGLALAVAELVAAVVSPTAAPLLAVGSAFIDLTPAWLKDFAIRTFGTNDKLALVVGMGAVVTLLAAAAGVVSLRSRRAGTTLVLLLGVVAAAAAVTRAAAGPMDALPSLLGTGAGALVLRMLVDRLEAGRPEPASSEPMETASSAGRRSFLVAGAVTAGVAVAGWATGRFVGRQSRDVAATRATLDLPQPASPAPAPPPGVTLDVEGISRWQTPNPEFYRIDTALTVPRIAPEDWSLRIHGDVEQEVEITLDELRDGGLVERWVTLTCVSNEVGGDLVGNALWLGLPIRQLLARARPTDGADMVLSRSIDGFSASTPLDVLMRGDEALLAIAMNGEPLPLEHGYPVRMVVPGLYGYVSATKWVVDLEVTRFSEASAYWTDRGWAERGPVKTASRIDVPGPFARLTAGRVVVAGVAWAQTRGIGRVEVQVDDGPWQEARLAAAFDEDTWRQWAYDWDAIPGEHTLRVRATDGTGQLQTQEDVPPVPDGATGWHSVVTQVT